jgi:hypothetical protein
MGNPILPLNIEQLNALALRLRDHAEDIAVEIAFEPIVSDIGLACRACQNLAGLRFRVAEIAGMALAGQPGAVTHRDLRAALSDAES